MAIFGLPKNSYLNTNMKNYCPELFKTLYIEKVDKNLVKLGHCCRSQYSEPTDKITFDNEFLAKGRQYFLDTQELPPACETCITIEAQGGVSRRTAGNNNFSDDPAPFKSELRSLDYNCDMVCNLKCIICSSRYSSSWLEDDYKLGKITDLKIRKTKDNQVLDLLDCSNINQVYFNGGEPLMTNDHINVLTRIIDSGRAADTGVIYSTNATIPLTDKFLSIWEKFKSVWLLCSIDGVGDVFEYVRFPGNWASVEKNISDYKKVALPNMKFFICPTIGLHNVLYINDLYNWSAENGYQFHSQGDAYGPLSLTNFPVHLRDNLLNYLTSLPESTIKQTLLSLSQHRQDNQTDSNYWIRYLNQLDSIRGNSWRASLSKLYNLDPAYFDKH